MVVEALRGTLGNKWQRCSGWAHWYPADAGLMPGGRARPDRKGLDQEGRGHSILCHAVDDGNAMYWSGKNTSKCANSRCLGCVCGDGRHREWLEVLKMREVIRDISQKHHKDSGTGVVVSTGLSNTVLDGKKDDNGLIARSTLESALRQPSPRMILSIISCSVVAGLTGNVCGTRQRMTDKHTISEI